MVEYLRGVLGFKGERGEHGYSAYEIAVQHGFVGSEADWLASIGKSSKFNISKTLYISLEGQTQFNIPNSYDANSFIDIYIDGLKLTASEYTLDTTNDKIVMANALSAGAEVEVVVLTMSTNNLPIVTSINETSTYETAAAAKAVYDALINQINLIYPVGTVISNITNSNPGNTLVNTLWESLGSESKFDTTIYYYKRIA